jgi:hypothetical protein
MAIPGHKKDPLHPAIIGMSQVSYRRVFQNKKSQEIGSRLFSNKCPIHQKSIEFIEHKELKNVYSDMPPSRQQNTINRKVNVLSVAMKRVSEQKQEKLYKSLCLSNSTDPVTLRIDSNNSLNFKHRQSQANILST